MISRIISANDGRKKSMPENPLSVFTETIFISGFNSAYSRINRIWFSIVPLSGSSLLARA
jgi:hypothetical protein